MITEQDMNVVVSIAEAIKLTSSVLQKNKEIKFSPNRENVFVYFVFFLLKTIHLFKYPDKI